MAQETRPLQKDDEVYIKPLGLYGRVLDIRGAGEPPEDQFCRVEITRYFRPTDLEVVDHEAERQKREAEIQGKADRMTRAHDRIAAGDKSTETALELLHASSELWQALGHKPLIVKK